jgi:hypothetical protein
MKKEYEVDNIFILLRLFWDVLLYLAMVDAYKALYEYLATNLHLSYNKKIIITCGIPTVPNTRTHKTGLEYSISRY